MSATPSPVISPAVLPSPQAAPPPPMSKRDKRRNLMAERLRELQTNFERDRDIHYRSQLSALQQNLQAIAKLDTSCTDRELLDDDPETIERLLGDGMPVQERIGGSGFFLKYVQGVNDFIEERDVSLAMLKKNHEDKIANLKHHHLRNLTQARLEHYQLASSLKARLISKLLTSKKKLSADKDHHDIIDTSALYNPDKYSLAPPNAVQPYMSPSRDTAGASGRRNLRQRRNGDDFLTPDFPMMQRSGRSRRGNANSPLPGMHRADSDDETSSPRANDIAKPGYTLESLFTKSEIQNITSVAVIAASRFSSGGYTSGEDDQSGRALTPESIERELSAAAGQIGTRSVGLGLPNATAKNQICSGPTSLKAEDASEDLELIRKAMGGSAAALGGVGMKRSASVAGLGDGGGKRKRGGN